LSKRQDSDRPRCAVEGCKEPWRTKGFCGAHYAAFHRYGDPLGTAPPRPGLEERFWAKVEKTGGCWWWRGALFPNGYGSFKEFPRPGICHLPHRFAYERLVGPIPEGLDLDHLCRNRTCVNPAHLEPVTRRENLLRGDTIPARKNAQTHCIHGHPFDKANTYIAPNGTRHCRTCSHDRQVQSRGY
jgi:hypothetical protein